MTVRRDRSPDPASLGAWLAVAYLVLALLHVLPGFVAVVPPEGSEPRAGSCPDAGRSRAKRCSILARL
jgi:hypothetical protein